MPRFAGHPGGGAGHKQKRVGFPQARTERGLLGLPASLCCPPRLFAGIPSGRGAWVWVWGGEVALWSTFEAFLAQTLLLCTALFCSTHAGSLPPQCFDRAADRPWGAPCLFLLLGLSQGGMWEVCMVWDSPPCPSYTSHPRVAW